MQFTLGYFPAVTEDAEYRPYIIIKVRGQSGPCRVALHMVNTDHYFINNKTCDKYTIFINNGLKPFQGKYGELRLDLELPEPGSYSPYSVKLEAGRWYVLCVCVCVCMCVCVCVCVWKTHLAQSKLRGFKFVYFD